MGPNAQGKALRLVLGIASIHSVALGVAIYFFTRPLLTLTGFIEQIDPFYPRQSGVFLVAFGVGYGLASRDPQRHRGLVVLTILSKTLAVVFLLSEAVLFQAPRSVWAAAVLDGAFAAVVAYLAWGLFTRRG